MFKFWANSSSFTHLKGEAMMVVVVMMTIIVIILLITINKQ
jgi:hypothetical protein